MEAPSYHTPQGYQGAGNPKVRTGRAAARPQPAAAPGRIRRHWPSAVIAPSSSGPGPNGLAAAIVLARAGRVGHGPRGGRHGRRRLRSAELTLPGFVHDICSTVHALALASPFLRTLAARRARVRARSTRTRRSRTRSTTGRRSMLERSVDGTAVGLGADDGRVPAAVRAARRATPRVLFAQLLGPLRRPRHPLALARFGLDAVRSGRRRSRASRFRERARAGAVRRLRGARDAAARRRRSRAALRPRARDGRARRRLAGRARRLAAPRRRARGAPALARRRGRDRARGRLARRPAAGARRCCSTSRRARSCAIAGAAAAGRYRRRLERFRYGPGVFKIDWALDGPIPWTAPECRAGRDGPPRRDARGDRRRRGGGRGAATTRRGRSSCSCSPAASTARRAPAGRNRRGPTATCRTARRVDMTERDRGAGRALRARVPRLILGPLGDGHAPRSSAATRTTSAATSTAARRTSRQLFTRPVAAPRCRTRRRRRASTSAPRRRRRAAASTACAATGRRARRSPAPGGA